MDTALKLIEIFAGQKYPTIYEKLTGRESAGGAVSDYPSISNIASQDSLKHFLTIWKTPVPAELRGQGGNAPRGAQSLGVFPEIRRAYTTRDSDLYIWDYATGKDLIIYDYLCETILGVALFHPIPGVLNPSVVDYLLAVSTASEINLFGIKLMPSEPAGCGNTLLQLIHEPLFQVRCTIYY